MEKVFGKRVTPFLLGISSIAVLFFAITTATSVSTAAETKWVMGDVKKVDNKAQTVNVAVKETIKKADGKEEVKEVEFIFVTSESQWRHLKKGDLLVGDSVKVVYRTDGDTNIATNIALTKERKKEKKAKK